jgi:hypothetical protein
MLEALRLNQALYQQQVTNFDYTAFDNHLNHLTLMQELTLQILV